MSLTIKNNIYYKADYDSLLIQGRDDPDTPRPWNLKQEIEKIMADHKILLDMGCGTGSKIFPFATHLSYLIGLDPSQDMLDQALKNKLKTQLKNISLLKATAEAIPLSNHSIDIVTSILSRWDAAEISRVLKPEGVALIEFIGCRDKKDFKLLFGQDHLGWRGQFIEYEEDKYLSYIEEKFSLYFKNIRIKNGFWNTYYTVEGLKKLLSLTPTIRNYDPSRDMPHVEVAKKLFSTDKGIKLTQNRILIYAQDPKPI